MCVCVRLMCSRRWRVDRGGFGSESNRDRPLNPRINRRAGDSRILHSEICSTSPTSRRKSLARVASIRDRESNGGQQLADDDWIQQTADWVARGRDCFVSAPGAHRDCGDFEKECAAEAEPSTKASDDERRPQRCRPSGAEDEECHVSTVLARATSHLATRSQPEPLPAPLWTACGPERRSPAAGS